MNTKITMSVEVKLVKNTFFFSRGKILKWFNQGNVLRKFQTITSSMIPFFTILRLHKIAGKNSVSYNHNNLNKPNLCVEKNIIKKIKLIP